MAFVPVDRPASRPSPAPAAAPAGRRDDDAAYRLAVLLAAKVQGDMTDGARADEVRRIAFALVAALGGVGLGALREKQEEQKREET